MKTRRIYVTRNVRVTEIYEVHVDELDVDAAAALGNEGEVDEVTGDRILVAADYVTRFDEHEGADPDYAIALTAEED